MLVIRGAYIRGGAYIRDFTIFLNFSEISHYLWLSKFQTSYRVTTVTTVKGVIEVKLGQWSTWLVLRPRRDHF